MEHTWWRWCGRASAAVAATMVAAAMAMAKIVFMVGLLVILQSRQIKRTRRDGATALT